ncbi:MAG: hypothetical protein MUC66_09155 [Methanolinea sp.]|nr:hypothetical protein [Methanolinea sp.]
MNHKGKRANIRHLVDDAGLRFVQGSITDSEILKAHFVMRTASSTRRPSPPCRDRYGTRLPRERRRCVNGPLGVLVAARECGVKKVVYASSSSKIRLHYPCWREWKEFAPKLQVQEIRKKSL